MWLFLLSSACISFWEELDVDGWARPSPALLRPTSQWGFSIGAILGSGPNTKQSHKPSVDLATDDCDTSLRSSRVGASLNPASAAGLLPARSPQSQGATNRLTHLWKRRGEKETGRGWREEGFPWQTVNPRGCSRQEPQTTTNTCEANAQRSLSGAENTREPCCFHEKEEQGEHDEWSRRDYNLIHEKEPPVFYR